MQDGSALNGPSLGDITFDRAAAVAGPAGNINVNVATLDEALARVRAQVISGQGCAVATLNLDHVTKLRRSPTFLAAYRRHDIVTADGFPIVWLGRILGAELARTAGSDMLEPLVAMMAELRRPIAIVGSQSFVVEKAIGILRQRYPGLEVAFHISPSFGFDPMSAEAHDILARVRDSGAAICFIAFGAPKQELLAALGRDVAPGVAFVSIGASIDFVAGYQVRAPRWMQRLNLEWVWRLLRSPRRLFSRYAQCAAILPPLMLRALRLRLARQG